MLFLMLNAGSRNEHTSRKRKRKQMAPASLSAPESNVSSEIPHMRNSGMH